MAGVKKLIPLLDRVLIEKVAAPTKTVGGILLPESATQKVGARGGACHGGRPTTREGAAPHPPASQPAGAACRLGPPVAEARPPA